MRYSPAEFASCVIEGGQIVVFAGLGLLLTAIALGSACHVLRSLPRGFIQWSAAALAVLAFEAPFLWLVRIEPDVSLGEFAGAVVLGVIGFMLATCCTLALYGLGGLLVGPTGKTTGAEGADDRSPAARFAMQGCNESRPEDESSEGKKPIFGRELAFALGDLLVNLCGMLR
jgi:hypothetical protein